MARRSRRSRRSRSLAARLRRYLIEHRFSAAQGSLGAIALAAGLWLLWPGPPDRGPDLREAWQRSLQVAGQDFSGRNEGFRDGLVTLTGASLAASAKRHLPAGIDTAEMQGAGLRLAQVARTMPAIGVPAAGPGSAQAADVAVALPARPTPRDAVGAAATARGYARAAVATGRADGDVVVAQLLPRRVPSIEEPDAPTWLRHAVARPTIDGQPAIAVVMDDLGLNRRGTAALNQLKAPLTLSFLPYAGALEQQAEAGRAAGHELMLHLPMEPAGHEWPGPNALLSSLTPPDMASRLRAQLLSFGGFVGINNHMGSLLTAERGPMALVMAELRARGLLFLDSRTTAQSVAAAEARRAGVAHAVRDVFLDSETSLAAIRRQLALTEQIARRRGSAVAIGHPHDATIEALRGWLPTLEQRGFVLVPISTIVARQSCADGLLNAPVACGLYVSAHNTVE
jgi:polysaccharide deacetylase 2 family uncharacterized protein YibQ